MAHELTIREDGTVEMAYLDGVDRWHGLGNNVESGSDLATWRQRAGLDWRALRAQVRYATGAGQDAASWRTFGEMETVNGKQVYNGRVVLFRNDSGDPLGIVTTDFQIVQPEDIVNFWDGLVRAGGMELQTLGSLFGGRKLWALAKVGEDSILDKRNKVRRNLLIATALDGSMATNAFYCDTTVVCNNTLQAAFGEGGPRVKINHRTTFNMDKVKAELGVGLAVDNFAQTLAAMRRLAEKRVHASDAVLIACELVKPGYLKMDDPKEKHRVENGKPVAEICGRFLDRKMIGAEFEGYDGTAWGLLNSVTEYVDHAARAKSDDRRMDSAFFGKGAETKSRAMALLGAYEPSASGADLMESPLESVNAWLAKH